MTLFSPPGQERQVLNRSQKRAARRKYTTPVDAETPPATFWSLDITVEQLCNLQQGDQTLEVARLIAEGGSSTTANEGFFSQGGLLHRRHHKPCNNASTEVDQHTQCRKSVIELTYDIPMAGHLEWRKTIARILQRFYWPGIYRDVCDHCSCCEQWQKSFSSWTKRAPLIPLLWLRYTLPGGYCTSNHWRQSNRQGTNNSFFARVGAPEEILTDQGTNFTSQLMQEVHRLLHIKPIRTTPYHPLTDGLVERFNHTLKSMLRKTASKEG